MARNSEPHALIQEIPDELWIDIFMYLTDSLSSVFLNVPLTCKRFFRIIYHIDDNYKEFLVNHATFGSDDDHHQNTQTLTDNHESLVAKVERKFNSLFRKKATTTSDHDTTITTQPTILDDDWLLYPDSTRVNEPLYKLLLRLYSLNSFDDDQTEESTTTQGHNNLNTKMMRDYGSYRTCFERFKLFGFAMNHLHLFRRELCYTGTMITNLDAYKNTTTFDIHHSLPTGNTIVMTENFGSSSAGINVVNRPMTYNSGIHYFEFIVHKSGQYDNFLIGILLTEKLKLEECKDKINESGEKLVDRFFDVDIEYNFQFRDYLGSSNNFSFAIYDEGNCVYHKAHSTYNCSERKKYCTVDENIVRNKGFVIGVYFDSKNFKLAFSKNGEFICSMDFSQKMVDHPRFEAGQLAFYPALSMGQTNDACTFSTKLSLQKCSAIKSVVKELLFEKK
ncbi:hypothetical protein C9374_014402 [Naegleria lovaniensis]|uniref:B30.2/SPRY domain-containing protein n=1 Tax=Naegleria lovaniensis TaxID=51637 RepID=A0AA88GU98_NAELO|nr:uncharacterized protein C9374_014402 [Naegleria lovaniensis]KAG2389002.1 hypothetical protein C9374_014402 [Naegleria lovaniensis]